MRVGVVFSRADSRAAEPVLRRVARKADGWMPFLAPGREPATLDIHGRVYIAEGWQRQVQEALKLGFTDLSIGYNRQANPRQPHAAYLDASIAVKDEVDRMAGRW